MRDQEYQEPGAENCFEIDTKRLTAHKLPSTQGPAVMIVDGQCAAAASPSAAAGSPSPDVILVSESDPMTDQAGKAQWFEPFEIRRPKGFLEITVRIIQGTVALFLSLVALTFVVTDSIRLVKGGQQVFPQDVVYLFVIIESAILLLATLMVFVTARRFVYWRVNQAGIDQCWFGFRTWSLPWKEIVSRRLGPIASPSWFFLSFIPIAGGLYQPIVLEDRQGRKRKVNRLGTNGDRLDAILRHHLNPTGEARQAQTYWDAIQRALAIHSNQDPAQVPLHLCTRDSPVVRMKMHEPRLLPVCCNCLGPVAVRAPIAMSGGLIGFFNDNFLRLMIPLCAACSARTRRGPFGWIGPVVIAMALIVVGTLFFTLASVARQPWELAVPVVLGVPFILGALVILWKEIRRPSPAKLVKVVRASSGGDWMDVRFGNPDYARLVDALDPKAAGYDWTPEV
jgi:hypothetical protein